MKKKASCVIGLFLCLQLYGCAKPSELNKEIFDPYGYTEYLGISEEELQTKGLQLKETPMSDGDRVMTVDEHWPEVYSFYLDESGSVNRIIYNRFGETEEFFEENLIQICGTYAEITGVTTVTIKNEMTGKQMEMDVSELEPGVAERIKEELQYSDELVGFISIEMKSEDTKYPVIYGLVSGVFEEVTAGGAGANFYIIYER